MNENLEKIKYNKSSYEINNINSLLTQNLPTNKSIFNSTDNSILSTKINSSESLILKSLFINNDIRNFQMKNIKLKKKFFSTNKDINDNSYQKFMKSKISNNISKITLPKVENNNYKSLSPPPKKLTFNENITQRNIFSNNKNIPKYSFIQLKLRDELFNTNIFNQLGYNIYNNKNIFNESIKKQALIKKYIYEQKKLYKNELKNNELFKNKIINNEIKIQNIYKLVSHNELNRLIDYNLFLQNKIHDIKEKDFELCKKIELLKKEIKNLFIKIKIESDKLWVLFDIRNFLICVKESISIKKLPLFFRFYNSDYIDELSKINDNDIFILEKMGKQKKNINLFRIPTNLLVYIKAQNTIEKEIVDKRFYKYFNSNYIIFNNPEEFLEKYILTEKVMLNHLRNSLIQNNYNESQKIKFMDQIEMMEKQSKIFEDQYNKTKKIYIDLKNNNINNNKRYKKLSLLREDDKNILNNVNNNKNIDKFLEKEKEFKNNENFLKLLQKRYNIEKNQFLLKYNELKNTKKFRTEKEYVYYFIYKNILSLFKIYPEYFYMQRKFCFKTMNLYINNIKNCHKFPDVIIKSNVIYLLTIYENAITNFLLDYKNNLEKYNSTNLYLKLKKNLVINKKYILFQQQQILENKVKKMKFEKYNKKQTRYRYKKRNIVLSNTFTKFNRYNSLNNKNIMVKDNFCEDSNLLSY